MTERYNFEAVERKEYLRKEGDWLIYISPMPGGFQDEYAPARDFYKIQKQYHPNGVISFKGHFLGNVLFGITEYYDENGKLIKSIDENTKFGKIKPRHLVNIMEEVGLFNRETGEAITIEKPLPTDGNFYRTLFYLSDNKNMNIYFNPTEYSENKKELHPPQWVFSYLNGIIQTEYIVNGNTGEYQKYETEMVMVE